MLSKKRANTKRSTSWATSFHSYLIRACCFCNKLGPIVRPVRHRVSWIKGTHVVVECLRVVSWLLVKFSAKFGPHQSVRSKLLWRQFLSLSDQPLFNLVPRGNFVLFVSLGLAEMPGDRFGMGLSSPLRFGNWACFPWRWLTRKVEYWTASLRGCVVHPFKWFLRLSMLGQNDAPVPVCTSGFTCPRVSKHRCIWANNLVCLTKIARTFCKVSVRDLHFFSWTSTLTCLPLSDSVCGWKEQEENGWEKQQKANNFPSLLIDSSCGKVECKRFRVRLIFMRMNLWTIMVFVAKGLTSFDTFYLENLDRNPKALNWLILSTSNDV